MMPRPNRSVLLTGVACFACFGSKHEALGDRAYNRAAFPQALAEYRLAISQFDTPTLRAKAAFAALNADELLNAAEHFTALASADSARVTEAADGLERVARRASVTRNRVALQAALHGLQSLAEARAIGAFAIDLAVDLDSNVSATELLDLLAYAAAAAPDVGGQDSLMFEYGTRLRDMGRCESSFHVFASLVRRARVPEIVNEAQDHAASCGLRLGQQHLSRRRFEAASEWFTNVLSINPPAPYDRIASIGLGDVHVALGDFESALDEYRSARLGLEPNDSLYVVAERRMNAIFDANRIFR